MTYWTGSESSLVHDGIIHEYSTHSEAKVAFYKQLNARIKNEYPDAKWIIEPWTFYGDWISTIKDRPDKDELTPDMFFQESYGTQFVDDSRNFNSGMNITKDMVGSTQPNMVSEEKNRLIAAKAGINGAWYNWFGRFGGSKLDDQAYIPDFRSITEVYPPLKTHSPHP